MRTELLAPAGDLSRLKVALIYGADAVYFGGCQFSLRARASNFTLDDIKEASEFAHKLGKKVYVTVNMIPHNEDFEGLKEYLQTLNSYHIDAIICASLAILKLAKQVAPQMEVHISTQQTTTNALAVKYWQDNGADRVVLARELSLETLKLIKEQVSLPIEVFIHGGMCANYSGRCTLSNVFTNRDANRGGCAQSCRWSYHLYHHDKLIDRTDTLLSLGSKDLCAADYIGELKAMGVASLKIEGRMKTSYYLANVLKAYRSLLDNDIDEKLLVEAKTLLQRVSNRATSMGFYQGEVLRMGQLYNLDNVVKQNYVCDVVSYQDGVATVKDRNYFEKGAKLAVVSYKGQDQQFVADEIFDEQGNEVLQANKPMQILKIKVPVEVDEYCFIRLVEEQI